MRLLLVAAAFLALMAPSLAAPGATGAASLSAEAPTLEWQGAHFVAGALPHGHACARSLCDLVRVRVELDPAMPPPFPAFAANITWASGEDDFDLFLYDAWGFLVMEAALRYGAMESLRVPEIKPGEYTLVVAPFLVVDSAYAGDAALLFEEKAPTS